MDVKIGLYMFRQKLTTLRPTTTDWPELYPTQPSDSIGSSGLITLFTVSLIVIIVISCKCYRHGGRKIKSPFDPGQPVQAVSVGLPPPLQRSSRTEVSNEERMEDVEGFTSIEIAAIARMNCRRNQNPASINSFPVYEGLVVSPGRIQMRPRSIPPPLPQNDLPPSYEEILGGSSRLELPAGTFSAGSRDQPEVPDVQNPPPDYWISTQQSQSPIYPPGVR